MPERSPPHRFYLNQGLRVEQRLELPDRLAHQVLRVLRLRKGDKLTLFSGDGNEYRAAIQESSRRRIMVEITDGPMPGKVPGAPAIHLYQSMIKADAFEFVVQKATELGVTEITAVQASRSVVSLSADRAQSKLERWRRIAVEALEQSERSDHVDIHGPRDLSEVVQTVRDDLRLIAAERIGRVPLPVPVHPGLARASLLVGPEGGFTDDELRLAINAGWKPVSLGPTILRSETAAVAAIAIIRAVASGN